MKIKATFTGNNFSFGYKRGGIYELEIQHPKDYKETFATTIFGKDEFGETMPPCYYSTLIAFLRNWNHIEVIE